MERRVFGWTKAKVPVVGQGTWRMEHNDRKACIEALRAGLDAGATHIDTAELYGAGEVEKLVAEAIKGRREEVFLVSKVLPEHSTYAETLKSCEKTLKRLKTDRLDLYLLHWLSEDVPFEETYKAFEKLVKDGKVKAWGVSNFDAQDLQMALEIAGEKKIACNQVIYHLQDRGIETEVIPWCEKHNVPVVAYSPFGAGRFPRPRTEGGKVLKEIADAHEATPYQVALRFLARRPLVFTIPKAAKAQHAQENAAAGDLRLTDEELRRIDAAFPAGPGEEGVLTM
ncbi:MAG TPA: aldo/keto reductase [Myxococcaceae bacterium]|nr:aldo/keto reductase [Myxococcaceae bacterium]